MSILIALGIMFMCAGVFWSVVERGEREERHIKQVRSAYRRGFISGIEFALMVAKKNKNVV